MATEKDLKINVRSTNQGGGIEQAEKSTSRFKDSVKSARDSLRGLAYDIPGIGPLVERVFTPMGAVFTIVSAAVGKLASDLISYKRTLAELKKAEEESTRAAEAMVAALKKTPETPSILEYTKELVGLLDRQFQLTQALVNAQKDLSMAAIETDPSMSEGQKTLAKNAIERRARVASANALNAVEFQKLQLERRGLEATVGSEPEVARDIMRRAAADSAKRQFQAASTREIEQQDSPNWSAFFALNPFYFAGGPNKAYNAMMRRFAGSGSMYAQSRSLMQSAAGTNAVPTEAQNAARMNQIESAKVDLTSMPAREAELRSAAFDRLAIAGLQNRAGDLRSTASAAADIQRLSQENLNLQQQFLSFVSQSNMMLRHVLRLRNQ